MSERQFESKRSLLERLLEQGMVMVTLDARHSEVKVPNHLRDDLQLRLNLSYRFALPMEIREDGIHAQLTFGERRHLVYVPWPAVFLVYSHVSGEPFLFPHDVPPELMGALSAPGHDTRAQPALKVVSGGEGGSVTETANKNTQRSRSHLRVVK